MRRLFTLAALLIIFFTGVAQNFTKLDATCYNGTTNTYYFFSDNFYLSKKLGEPVMGPYNMNKWTGWDKLGWNSVDAAVYNEDTKTYYFFKGAQYSKKELGQPMGAPKNTVDGWPDFPIGRVAQQSPNAGWRDGFAPDGVIYDDQRKSYYFFRGNRVAIKPLGKPFTQSIPLRAAMQDKIVEIKTNDVDEDGASTILGNGVLNILEAVAFGDTNDDKFITDSYGQKKMVFPKFAQNWPEEWKVPSTKWGIKYIADGLYNTDTDTWYIFLNNSSTQQIEVLSWKDGKVEKNLRQLLKTGFGEGWPK